MEKENLKAYIVYDKWYAEGSIVVWAETSGKAKSKGLYHDNMDGFEYTDLRAYRMKDFDKYVESKHIPIAELLANGWWFYCADCGAEQINQNDVENGEAFIINKDYDREDFVKGNVICKKCYERLNNGLEKML